MSRKPLSKRKTSCELFLNYTDPKKEEVGELYHIAREKNKISRCLSHTINFALQLERDREMTFIGDREKS